MSVFKRPSQSSLKYMKHKKYNSRASFKQT